MKKIESKHLAAYLPYKVQMYMEPLDSRKVTPYTLVGSYIDTAIDFQNRPILKPLFAIPQEIVDMSPYNNHDELIEAIEDQLCPHNIWRVCVANHFDVFGLIEQGLAIDINTLTLKSDL